MDEAYVTETGTVLTATELRRYAADAEAREYAAVRRKTCGVIYLVRVEDENTTECSGCEEAIELDVALEEIGLTSGGGPADRTVFGP